ncbi:MAG: hypothetical protein M0Q22_06615 [Sulfuritalea sp.]|jgi:hypothetical protein|nr:hypothetical protein [Sulfuritalea sp.]
MKLLARLSVIASLHVAFLVSAYGSHFFGLHLPSAVVIPAWLLVSSAIALVAYWLVLLRSSILGATSHRSGKLAACAVPATLVSLYAGVFIAFNTFGT